MWPDQVHEELAKAGVRLVGYVPDAGHKRLIELCQADRSMRAVVLTTEEEGIGLAAGACLGGAKSVLLMQSSGVGNVINVLGMVAVCRFPLVMIITMRGEEGEFNPWQVPMGLRVRRATSAAEVAPLVAEALASGEAVAVLVSQKVIGIKSFKEQSEQ
jgi:sulfopyruvate decarboxylase alpha subunit